MEINLRDKITQEMPTLVEFINIDCEPCAMIEPTLQQVKNTIGKRVDIYVVNIQDVPEIVSEFSISTVPMLALFSNDKVIWKTSNILSKQEIIENVLNSI